MDIFIGYLTGWARFKDPGPFCRKGNSKFESLLVKLLSLKTKKIKYFQLLYKKYQIFNFQKNSLWFF